MRSSITQTKQANKLCIKGTLYLRQVLTVTVHRRSSRCEAHNFSTKTAPGITLMAPRGIVQLASITFIVPQAAAKVDTSGH